MTPPKVLINNPTGRGFNALQTIATNDGTADKVPATKTGGYLDASFFQESGIALLPASEIIAAGAQINVWDDAGTAKVRNATSASGLEAHGYTPAGIASGSTGQVIFQDGAMNNQLTLLTPGDDYYLGAGGAVTNVVPTAGMKQYVGTAVTASVLKQSWDAPVNL